MFQSKYDDAQKGRILTEKVKDGLTVKEICEKYNISVPTYYSWRCKLNKARLIELEQLESPEISIGLNLDLKTENDVLRSLYVNLSAHNYELAKFLKK